MGDKNLNNKPNLFIIGAPKAGTTALVNNLGVHNDIFVPNNKEPRFFDSHVFYDYHEDYPIKGLEEYLNNYNCDNAIDSKYLVDGSVFNMYSDESIKQILKLSPDAKFIIILRDPVSASISMHKQRLKYSDIKMREVSENFIECWDLLENRKNGKGYPQGCRNKFIFRYDLLYSYEKYLPSIIKLINKDNLFIGMYEDYKTNPQEFYDEIFDFLRIEKKIIENKKYNDSYVVKKTFILQGIETIASITLKLRKKLGLTGGIFSKMKGKIIDTHKIKIETNSEKLEKVIKSFESTYIYLKELKS